MPSSRLRIAGAESVKRCLAVAALRLARRQHAGHRREQPRRGQRRQPRPGLSGSVSSQVTSGDRRRTCRRFQPMPISSTSRIRLLSSGLLPKAVEQHAGQQRRDDQHRREEHRHADQVVCRAGHCDLAPAGVRRVGAHHRRQVDPVGRSVAAGGAQRARHRCATKRCPPPSARYAPQARATATAAAPSRVLRCCRQHRRRR